QKKDKKDKFYGLM
uniref:Tachykinin-like peptide-X n=1 Tax=Phoneutria nigriventer TaxID=6918 RepID=TLP10_PHONI|nr:RecName: Full=Tachykinin-like peptide-X; AltName: Full=P.nigriventer tachykinin peptides X; Short=PnTkP-X; AltName: Full=U29-ctenitoxin-Pn1j; Short=U29-CNTX-Pn1j [Phoneutria nigriventer]